MYGVTRVYIGTPISTTLIMKILIIPQFLPSLSCLLYLSPTLISPWTTTALISFTIY